MSTSGATTKPQDSPVECTKVVVKGDVLETKAELLTSTPLKIEWPQKWDPEIREVLLRRI
ncbi:hypothetical protein MMC28_000431 [Mycoblastus sanguinarius]|nr:hypothetical protein [Mycoblastus sanguinarius]